MRLLAAGLVASLAAVTLMALPAHAQLGGGSNDADLQYKLDQKAREDINQRYLDTVKRTRRTLSEPETNNDPWAGLRSTKPERPARR